MTYNSNNKGRVIWITGLSGAGKSTIARATVKQLRAQSEQPVLIDGDEIRDAIRDPHTGHDPASRLANGLVDKGLLARERDAEDGRVVRLVATPEGASTCSIIESDLTREYSEMLSHFDPEVRAAITRLVARLGRSFTARVEASGGSCCVV